MCSDVSHQVKHHSRARTAMVFRRRRTFRKRKVPRMRGRAAKAVRKVVKKEISKTVETKYVNVNVVSSVTTTPVISFLNTVAQGTTDQTRVGDVIKITSIWMRFLLTVGDTIQFVRLILFQWHPGTTPVAGDILQDTSNPTNSPYNVDAKPSYRILWDRTFPMSTTGDTAVRVITYNFRKAIRKTTFFAGSSTSAQENLYLFSASDSGIGPNPTLNLYARVNFHDC